MQKKSPRHPTEGREELTRLQFRGALSTSLLPSQRVLVVYTDRPENSQGRGHGLSYKLRPAGPPLEVAIAAVGSAPITLTVHGRCRLLQQSGASGPPVLLSTILDVPESEKDS